VDPGTKFLAALMREDDKSSPVYTIL